MSNDMEFKSIYYQTNLYIDDKGLTYEMFSHEYSAWSAILMRINVVKFNLAVACSLRTGYRYILYETPIKTNILPFE